jgi:hypothetical protein
VCPATSPWGAGPVGGQEAFRVNTRASAAGLQAGASQSCWQVGRGLGGATTDTWQSRRCVTPSDPGIQRHGWTARRSSASRVALSSNETTTSHGLYKLVIVVIVDFRVLGLYFYSLTNNIQLVQFLQAGAA